MMDDLEDSQDGESKTDDFNRNQLLPENETRAFELDQSEICTSNASGFPAARSEGLSLSSKGSCDGNFEDAVHDTSSMGYVNEAVVSDDGKNVQSNNYLQDNEEEGIMEFRQDRDKLVEQDPQGPVCTEEDSLNEGKKREERVRNSDSDEQKETVGSILEPSGSDLESMAVESIEHRKERDRTNDISKDGAKGDLSEDDTFVSDGHGRVLETGLHHDDNKELVSNNHSSDEMPINRAFEDVDNRGFNEHSERKTDEVGHKDMVGINTDSGGRDEANFHDDSWSKNDADSTLSIADETKNQHVIQKDYFDEEESEYHSVASHRYSSFESLDDARDKTNNPTGKGSILGNGVEIEAGTRPILGSETDRTEDDYITCDEQSTIGADGHGDEDNDDNNELQSYLDEHEIPVTDGTVNEFRGRNVSSSGFDDYDDCEGYETQEYLTADDQSEFGGTAESIRCIEGEDESHTTQKKKTDLVAASTEDLVQLDEEGAVDVMTEGEEYATADEMIKGDEDERSTIVASDDDEGGDKVTGHEHDVNDNELHKPNESEIVNQTEARLSDLMAHVNSVEDVSLHEDDKVFEEGNGSKKEENTINSGLDENEKKAIKRKKSFFHSMMAKKEKKIEEKLFGFSQRYEAAVEGIAQANTRFKKAKSDLPLMIVEKRIPKVEELQRKTEKLEELKSRLESYIEFNRSTNDYIQNWRNTEGSIDDKKAEFQRSRSKTSERQKLLMASKKRQSFLHSELTRQDDLQLHKQRRINQLTERLDMMKLRQTEQRNLVKKRIDEAKKYCELSVREAAKVVVANKRVGVLKAKVKELEDKIFNIKKDLKKVRQMRKEKEFEVERANIQKSVKAMKKERGW